MRQRAVTDRRPARPCADRLQPKAQPGRGYGVHGFGKGLRNMLRGGLPDTLRDDTFAWRIVECLQDLRTHRLDIVGIENYAVATLGDEFLCVPRMVRLDAEQPGRQRLIDHERARIAESGQDKVVAATVDGRNPVVVNEAKELDPIAYPELLRLLPKPLLFRSASRHRERPLPIDSGKSLQGDTQSLTLVQRTNEKQARRAVASCAYILDPELLRVDAVVQAKTSTGVGAIGLQIVLAAATRS